MVVVAVVVGVDFVANAVVFGGFLSAMMRPSDLGLRETGTERKRKRAAGELSGDLAGRKGA